MPSDWKADSDRALRDAITATQARREHFVREMARREAQSARLSLARLILFIGAGVLVAAAYSESSALAAGGALLLGSLFLVAVIAQQRVVLLLDDARERRDIHERHLWRMGERWTELASQGAKLIPADHAYAWDVDVVGPGSLFQRIDVTHTVLGEHTLASWLSRPATPEVIAARQAAVQELKSAAAFREDLEAAALRVRGSGAQQTEKLDGAPFAKFAQLPSYFAAHRALTPIIFALPLLTLLCYVLGRTQVLPSPIWLLPFFAHIVLVMRTGAAVRRAFDLAASRQGVAEAFMHMLQAVERAQFQSAHLSALRERLFAAGTAPSVHMRSLRSWTSAAELRQQFLLYIVVAPLTLWDLHVLRGLEQWNRRVGPRTSDWFEALGELEALCSLATLAFVDAGARMPEIGAQGEQLRAEELVHPLLPAAHRVPNDVQLGGPGCALLVTGSNMAGKSTLLRALGLNVALALAGGPVCAMRMRVPPVRLRASMRAEDSLQRGASYFHAELQKLKTVVAQAETAPPILFLLDELLRGTNARARHLGAKAVLLHLLKRGALGLVATHDVALATLEQAHPGRIRNVHFTDVMQDGEMRFDYRLRPGVVQTSNALRLLAMAGIDVPEDEIESNAVQEVLQAAAHSSEKRI